MASNHYNVKENNEKIILIKMTVEEIHNYHPLNEQQQKDVVQSFMNADDLSQTCAFSLDYDMRSYDNTDYSEADRYTLKFEEESTISVDQKKQLIETLYNSFNASDRCDILATLGVYI